MYLPGEEVTISAEAQNQTQHFSHWEVTGTAAVRDADSAATTLIMGDGDATVTAVYEDHWVENDDHSCLTAAICGDCAMRFCRHNKITITADMRAGRMAVPTGVIVPTRDAKPKPGKPAWAVSRVI